jgi:hypothetical protein
MNAHALAIELLTFEEQFLEAILDDEVWSEITLNGRACLPTLEAVTHQAAITFMCHSFLNLRREVESGRSRQCLN